MISTSGNSCNERLAWYLTLLPARFLAGLVSLGGLAHVVAGGRAVVLRSGRAAGAGFAGFRRAGQSGQCLADVPEPAADPCGGQPAGRAGPLPGQPDIGGQAAGEASLRSSCECFSPGRFSAASAGCTLGLPGDQ